MATYVIGDVQGCYATLMKLLSRINFDKKNDQIIFLGDVINRGPNSLNVLNLIMKNSDCMKMVLGNHEIFAIAIFLGAVSDKKNHTLKEVFAAKNCEKIFSFLRNQPLMIKNNNDVFVHAGILPKISIKKAEKLSHLIAKILRGDEAKNFLARFYEKTPKKWKDDESERYQAMMALSFFTLLRMCSSKSNLDLKFAGRLSDSPKELSPWFSLRQEDDCNIYFGHWAALGLYKEAHVFCLDSGCVWGRELSALRLDDQHIFQVKNCEEKK